MADKTESRQLANVTRDPQTGRIASAITPERRAEIIEAAKAAILQGRTLREIATEHGISRASLCVWLAGLGDEYRELRQAWLDSMLAHGQQAIDDAADPLDLARAREQWRYATWYAERRDPARYGQRQQIDVRTESLADVLLRVSRED